MTAGTTAPTVTLIGLMGAGKSKVGRLTAERLGRAFVDTDALIAQRAGRTVANIFATDGEAIFRTLERAAVAEAVARTGAIVAVGGGAALDERNVACMRAAGPVVWLYAEPETLASRLRRSVLRRDRPLLADAGPVDGLRTMLDGRGAADEAGAAAVLRADGLAVAQSTQLLVTWLREHA